MGIASLAERRPPHPTERSAIIVQLIAPLPWEIIRRMRLSEAIPINPTGKEAPMPHYRHDHTPGATWFFPLNLTDRQSRRASPCRPVD
ncbi:hypothetical protein D9M68_759850 [compost metagenome]